MQLKLSVSFTGKFLVKLLSKWKNMIFDLYKGFFMEKNELNSSDFEKQIVFKLPDFYDKFQ